MMFSLVKICHAIPCIEKERFLRKISVLSKAGTNDPPTSKLHGGKEIGFSGVIRPKTSEQPLNWTNPFCRGNILSPSAQPPAPRIHTLRSNPVTPRVTKKWSSNTPSISRQQMLATSRLDLDPVLHGDVGDTESPPKFFGRSPSDATFSRPPTSPRMDPAFLEGVLVDEGDEVLWKHHAHATRFAQELVDAPRAECGFGLERIALSTSFLFTEPDANGSDVITKKSSRQVYDAAFNVCKTHPGARVLLEGQQGIGKSRNLIYLLKRFLETGTLVLLQFCKRDMVYAFVPIGKSYIVYSVKTANFTPEYCPAMHLGSTVLLFDPAVRALEPAIMPCSMVVAANPTFRHFAAFIREPAIWLFKVNPYTADEAAEYFRLVGHHIPQKEFAQRFFQVGGSLRNLRDPARIQMATDAQERAVLRMTDGALSKALGDGMKFLVSREAESGEEYPSALFAHSNFNDPNDYETYRLGSVTKPVSAVVEDRIAHAAYGRLYGQLKSLLRDGRSVEASYQLEVLGRVALARGGKFKVRELVVGAKETVLELPSAVGGVRATMDMDTDWRALPEDDGTVPRTVLYSLSSTYPNVDVVDSRYRGYNFSVSPSHPIAYMSLIKQLDNVTADSRRPLCLYFCVPDSAFTSGYQTAQAMQAKNVNVADDLAEAVSKRLRQFLLLIPQHLPKL